MTKVVITRAHPGHVQFGQTLTSVRLGLGLPPLEELQDELMGYIDVLAGRKPPEVDSPYLQMQEVATAFHTRAREIEMLILIGEEKNLIARGSPLYKFRTGPLNSFIEAAKRCVELGSRRMTQEELLYRQRLEGKGM